ncbi:MAG: hypothetical protein QOF61_102 [Acidobacteriota bacterium]|jgi:glycosyltransferase involved in cell wall biosynthesis|nr:hypothetical protein [Acidobacteriota bacterium]
MSDTFSIAMCTYNGARHLAAQLASLSAQTRLPDELVMCDDRSEDETRAIIGEFAARAPFPVRLHVNERNLGSTKNFERAISLCAGDLIALSDQDDVWLPHKLERLAERFAACPRTGLVFTDAEVVDEDLRPTDGSLWDIVGFGDAQQRLVRCGRALDVLLPGWTVTGATMAFRAKFKGIVLDIPDDLPIIHDGWIAAVVAAVADVEFIAEPLVKYRQHPRQQIGAPRKGAAERDSKQGMEGAVAAARRANDYDHLIEIAERVSLRLSEREGFSDSGGARRRLDALVGHLRTRADLPQSRLRRSGYVLRELLTWRYHLYSNGVSSAVKDLLT